MHELTMWMVAALAGIALGLIFYGGLWWTVRKGVDSQQPALWFLGSLLARMAVVAGGLVLVGGGDWRRVLLCLLGMAIGRVAVTRLTRANVDLDPQRELPYAP